MNKIAFLSTIGKGFLSGAGSTVGGAKSLFKTYGLSGAFGAHGIVSGYKNYKNMNGIKAVNRMNTGGGNSGLGF